jgi:hypothetical protein
MDARVDESEWIAYQWPYVMTLLGGAEELERVGRDVGAFQRSREVKSAADLLQLLMLWSVAGCSLRQTAIIAEEAGLATISNVGLLKRFQRCLPFVNALLGRLLVGKAASIPDKYRVRLIDATTASAPGSKGTDYRIHLGLDLSTSAIDAVEVTDFKGGETFDRFVFAPNEIVIADRGYAHRSGLKKIAEAGGHFIVRQPYNSIPLENESGSAFDTLTALRGAPEAKAVEHPVWITPAGGQRLRCRLVAIRKTEAATQDARGKMIAEARKKGPGGTSSPLTLPPVSNWRLTRLLFTALVHAICPPLSLVSILAHAHPLARHIRLTRRRRIYQRRTAQLVGRQSLAA